MRWVRFGREEGTDGVMGGACCGGGTWARDWGGMGLSVGGEPERETDSLLSCCSKNFSSLSTSWELKSSSRGDGGDGGTVKRGMGEGKR